MFKTTPSTDLQAADISKLQQQKS